MTYDSRAVANHFLKLGEGAGDGISPMKLLKLVYFAHGWALALTGAPLISEPVEAWEYGPVVRQVYSAFRNFGDKPITEPAFKFVIVDGRLRKAEFEIFDCDSEHDYTRALLARIWETYGKFQAIQLSNMSHDPNGPWFKTRSRNPGARSPVIANEEIRDYFKQQLTA